MRSQGSAYGHFRRALTSGNSTLALVAAAELPQVTLEDALALCRLLAEQRDERYPRAAARWLQRFAAETTATLAEVQLAAASLARLQRNPVPRWQLRPWSASPMLGLDGAILSGRCRGRTSRSCAGCSPPSRVSKSATSAAFQSVEVGNFERRFDEVREIFDPEVEWVAAPHSLLASEEYRGSDGVRHFWTQFLSAWDEYGVEVEELIDAGDQVVAVMRLSGRTNELEIDEVRSSLLTLRH